MAFTVQIENDWLLLETGTDNILLEDAVSNLIVEEAAEAFLDLTQYLLYDSITLKFNTIDFTLLDLPVGAVHLREDFKTTDPAWTGNIAAVETSDPTKRIGHTAYKITGTNTALLPSDTAPFDLSESPTDGTFQYLQEDGVSHLLLEDGTDFAPGVLRIEGPLSYQYKDLTVRTQVNTTGPITALGRCTVFQPGLRPGNQFKLTSTNQGYAAFTFQVNQVNISWPTGKNPPVPVYGIEFGDTPQTLALWTQLSAPSAVVPVSPPVVIPVGPVVYANATTGHTLFAQGGGIVTIASANFTVAAPVGHTNAVQIVAQIDCRAYAWDNYVATPRRAVRAILSGGIFTGSWQETPAGTPTTAGARGTYDLSSAPGISLPDGSYTVSVQIDTQEFNQMEVFSAYAQAVVTTT